MRLKRSHEFEGVRGVSFSSPDSLSICAASRGVLCKKFGSKAEFVEKAIFVWWNWSGNTIPLPTEKHQDVAEKLYDVYIALGELKDTNQALWLELSCLFLRLPWCDASKQFNARLKEVEVGMYG